jgi:glycosyltransferase involved in cell wall biosynthesis
MKRHKIKIIGPACDTSGISKCVREISLRLFDLGQDVRIADIETFSVNKYPFTNQTEAQKIAFMKGNRLYGEDFFTIHFYPLDRFINYGANPYNIFFNMFETDKIPDSWKLILNDSQVKEVWVPTKFNYNTFKDSGVVEDKLKVVNLGVDLNKYPFKERLLNQEDFKFLFISEFRRAKGYELLLSAFYEEFKNDSNVKLLFKCTTNTSIQMDNFLKTSIQPFKKGSKAEVILITGSRPEEFMNSLYEVSDCFVLPTRGEGWCLPAVQAMAAGLPLIITNATAPTEYCTNENSMLVSAYKKEIDDLQWLWEQPAQKGHCWWDPDFNDLKKKLRFAYENREACQKLATQARKDIEKYTWENTAKQIISNLDGIKP